MKKQKKALKNQEKSLSVIFSQKKTIGARYYVQ